MDNYEHCRIENLKTPEMILNARQEASRISIPRDRLLSTENLLTGGLLKYKSRDKKPFWLEGNTVDVEQNEQLTTPGKRQNSKNPIKQ